jgi:S-adenosylmethionine:tRNA ribosyltransferase-isomerase
MIAPSAPLQRALDAKLLVVDAQGGIRHAPRAALAQQLRPSDLVVANDAATLPASLHGRHTVGIAIEVRLADGAL